MISQILTTKKPTNGRRRQNPNYLIEVIEFNLVCFALNAKKLSNTPEIQMAMSSAIRHTCWPKTKRKLKFLLMLLQRQMIIAFQYSFFAMLFLFLNGFIVKPAHTHTHTHWKKASKWETKQERGGSSNRFYIHSNWLLYSICFVFTGFIRSLFSPVIWNDHAQPSTPPA